MNLVPQEHVLVSVEHVWIVLSCSAPLLREDPLEQHVFTFQVERVLAETELLSQPGLPNNVLEEIIVLFPELFTLGKLIFVLGPKMGKGRSSLELPLSLCLAEARFICYMRNQG